MPELNMFRLTVVDGGTTVHRDLIDAADPDRMTSIGLADWLILCLKRDQAWPSDQAQLAKVEWLGAGEGPIGSDRSCKNTGIRRYSTHAMLG